MTSTSASRVEVRTARGSPPTGGCSCSCSPSGAHADSRRSSQALEQAGLAAVLYEDVNDPTGVALLIFGESPDDDRDRRPPVPPAATVRGLAPKPEYTMLGRTYAIGHEADLAEALDRPPKARVCDPALRWAIWYPLRRAGSFERLPREEQNVILMEHARHRAAFGRAGLGYDIRLACHGLDKNDNDFVIGLLGQSCTRSRSSSSGCGRRSRRRSISIGSGRSSSGGWRGDVPR